MEKQKFEQKVKQLGIQIETDISYMFTDLEVTERTVLLQQYRKVDCNLFEFFQGLPVERQTQFTEFLENTEQRNSRTNQKGQPIHNILEKKKTVHSGIHEPAGNSIYPNWKTNP